MEFNVAQLGVSCDFRNPENRIDLYPRDFAKNDLHLQPGKGDLNWDLFSEIYSSMDFSNPVILECETWGKNTYKEMLEAFSRKIKKSTLNDIRTN